MFRFSAAVSLLLVSNAGVNAFMAMPPQQGLTTTSLSAVVDINSAKVLEEATPDTPINRSGATLKDIEVDVGTLTMLDPSSIPLPDGDGPFNQVRRFDFDAGTKVKPHTHDGNTFNIVQKGKVTVTVAAEDFSQTFEAGDIFMIEEGTKYGLDADTDVSIMCGYYGCK